jgi:undecaprenyl-diphosphatase
METDGACHSALLRGRRALALRQQAAWIAVFAQLDLARERHGMTHLTYLEAAVVGLVQGVSELFPVSSLGHNVLIPALVGGSWAKDLNVSAVESPYLAFIVGLHVATAIALLIYFWRDWVRIIRGFVTSLGHFVAPPPGASRWQLRSADEKLAWMIILATIPVGIAGLAFEHIFRVVLGKPVYAAVFLVVNGLILLAGERFLRRSSRQAGPQPAAEPEPELALSAAGRPGVARHAAGHQATRSQEIAEAVDSDERLSAMGYGKAVLIGSAQILALLAGISRSGVTMVTGMTRGLSREDAARFAFLLATPVILAAGALKIPDLIGPLGNGIRGQVLLASVLSGIGAYLSVRFLVRYFRTRTLTPFAIYCLVAGLGSITYLELIK